MTTQAFTDGACIGNPGPGGWAYVVDRGPFASGAAAATTNQRMELQAAFSAVRDIEGPLEIVSDSTYVVNCFEKKWYEGWHKRGWKNSQKKPVANRDLWEPFIDLVLARGDVQFTWVKGHSGHRMNDAADALATTAAAEQGGRSGEIFSDAVVAGLDADAPGGPTHTSNASSVSRSSVEPAAQRLVDKSAPSVPANKPASEGPTAGHLVAVVGHRPPELGGYGDNPVLNVIRRQLIDVLRAKKELEPDLVVATGLGIGTEMLAAEAAAAASVPYVAVLAFEGLELRWPQATRRRFDELRADARDEVVIVASAPKSPTEFGKAMGRRDDWLARHAKEAIVVRRADDRTLAEVQRKLERTVGDDLWVLEPPS
ncbi:MAG: ribonuclease HI [Candidatus Poriferisodalaceae bacterium]|jgi:ribonuclease HI